MIVLRKKIKLPQCIGDLCQIEINAKLLRNTKLEKTEMLHWPYESNLYI